MLHRGQKALTVVEGALEMLEQIPKETIIIKCIIVYILLSGKSREPRYEPFWYSDYTRQVIYNIERLIMLVFL